MIARRAYRGANASAAGVHLRGLRTIDRRTAPVASGAAGLERETGSCGDDQTQQTFVLSPQH